MTGDLIAKDWWADHKVLPPVPPHVIIYLFLDSGESPITTALMLSTRRIPFPSAFAFSFHPSSAYVIEWCCSVAGHSEGAGG